LGLAGTLVYLVWIGGPYLRSIIVRDAAVTTWISIVPAPISGYTTDLLYPGDRVGEDGRIAKVDNPLADPTALASAQRDRRGLCRHLQEGSRHHHQQCRQQCRAGGAASRYRARRREPENDPGA